MNLKKNVTIVVSGRNNKAAMQQWLNWYLTDTVNIIICETNSSFEYSSKSNITYLRGEDKTQIINKAIDLATTKYVMLTHVNIRPEEKMICHLLSSLILNKKICACSPRIDFMSEVHYSGTFLYDHFFNFRKLNLYKDGVYSSDTVTKECMMIRKSDWNLIGKLDPNFKGVYDDIDWSSRAKDIGFTLGVNFNTKATTLGKLKFSTFRKNVSKHLWINKNCYIQHKLLIIIASIIKNCLLLPIDVITLKPQKFYQRFCAIYLAYFNIKKIPDIE